MTYSLPPRSPRSSGGRYQSKQAIRTQSDKSQGMEGAEPRGHAGWVADPAEDGQEGRPRKGASVYSEASGKAFSKEKKRRMEQKRLRDERAGYRPIHFLSCAHTPKWLNSPTPWLQPLLALRAL